MSNLVKLILLIAFVVFLLLFAPWCMIWAVNTLVHAGGVASFTIPFDFWTWLAAVILGGFSFIAKSKS